jgi:hypothetical protein
MNSDPLPEERVYYVHQDNGDRGYLVIRKGKERIRLRADGKSVTVPMGSEWKREDRSERAFSKMQVASIAFDADRNLCRMIGKHEQARKEWIGLTDRERIAWADHGPTDSTMRVRLYTAIRAAFDRGEA